MSEPKQQRKAIRAIEKHLEACACVRQPLSDEEWFYAKPGTYLEQALLKLEIMEAEVERLREIGMDTVKNCSGCGQRADEFSHCSACTRWRIYFKELTGKGTFGDAQAALEEPIP